jgi:hypothetical protein
MKIGVTRKQSRREVNNYTRHPSLLMFVVVALNVAGVLPLVAAIPAFAFIISELGGTRSWLLLTMLVFLAPDGAAVFASHRLLRKDRPAAACTVAALPVLCEAILLHFF